MLTKYMRTMKLENTKMCVQAVGGSEGISINKLVCSWYRKHNGCVHVCMFTAGNQKDLLIQKKGHSMCNSGYE